MFRSSPPRFRSRGAGKEYIADDVQDIQDAVKSAIQNCCIQLKKKIVRQQAAREQRQRKKNLVKYIPNVSSAVFTVLQSISDRGVGRVAEEQIFADIRKGSVTEVSLTEMLERHVERIDTDMAMEYQMQQGKGNKVIAYLVPKSSRHRFADRAEHDVALISLLGPSGPDFLSRNKRPVRKREREKRDETRERDGCPQSCASTLYWYSWTVTYRRKTRSFAVYMWYSGRRKPVADSFLVYSRPTLGITFHAKEMLYSKPSNPFPAFISLANVNGYILGSLRMSSLASSRSSMILFQSTISLCGDVSVAYSGHHVYVELLGVPGELWGAGRRAARC